MNASSAGNGGAGFCPFTTSLPPVKKGDDIMRVSLDTALSSRGPE